MPLEPLSFSERRVLGGLIVKPFSIRTPRTRRSEKLSGSRGIFEAPEEHLFFYSSSSQEHQHDCDENRYKYKNTVEHVSKKAWHLDARLLGDRLHHEVWAVPNVSVGAHEDRAQGDRQEKPRANPPFGYADGLIRRRQSPGLKKPPTQ